jgi:hypothetical protein
MIEPVTPDLAAQAAGAWLARLPESKDAGRAAVSVLETIPLDDENPGLHLVTNGITTVLVAGDLQAQPILGWADHGDLQGLGEDIPDGLRELLAAWGLQILLTRPAPPDRAGAANPNREAWAQLLDTSVRAATEEAKEIPPLLGARWGQGAGWNAHCPVDAAGPAGRAYAGCVATAMGQVLFHHRHPGRGRHIQSYWHDRYGDIGLNFLEETPAWKGMAARGATDAAARLLFLAGVAVRMNYGPRSSTASSSNVPTALKAFLRYADSTRLVWRASTPPETWEALIQEELLAGRPIIHRGQGAQGGHAFNLDGWRSDGFKHLNFGWNGSYNGWYTLDDITPGSWGFTGAQGMVIGIQPAEEELISPPDGEHNVPAGMVTLRWRPRSGMARVELEVATNAQFSTVIRRAAFLGAITKHALGGLAPSTRHFWRLTWVDKVGNRRTTLANSFVTGALATTGGPGAKPKGAQPEQL